MKHSMYVIYDSAAKMYNKPFFFINDAVAYRAACDLMQDTNNEITKNPSDYTMSCLGTYDDETAEFELFTAHKVIARFIEINRKSEAA